VGAGASKDFGLPDVAEIGEILAQRANELYPLAQDPGSSLYSECARLMSGHLRQGRDYQSSSNFEQVLYQLQRLATWHSNAAYGLNRANVLWQPQILPKVLEAGRSVPTDGRVLHTLANQLVDVIVDEMVMRCACIDPRSELEDLSKFLSALREHFEIAVLTLNYDNLFEKVAPDLFTGFDHSGSFDPPAILMREPWDLLYHLHGSIHFTMARSDHELHEIQWCMHPRKSHDVHGTGRSTQNSGENVDFPTSIIVTGLEKPQQLLREPFRTYYAQGSRLVHQADAVLVLGYGFADAHVNALLKSVRRRPRPVVVVDYAEDDQDPLAFRNDPWAFGLFEALPGTSHGMSARGGSSPAEISELREAKAFEVSHDANCPLAVWYNGMSAACQYPDRIVAELSA